VCGLSCLELTALSAPVVIPSPHHPLHGFRLKLNRAQTHAEALDAEIKAWFDNHPYAVFSEYKPGPPEQYVFKTRFFEAIPASWGITLGDFAHNARSALDHLAYQVVMAGNGGMDERTQFPIVVCPFEWLKQAKSRIGNASERHIGIIESYQPYHRPDLFGWHSVWGAIEDPLAVLSRLSNVDKHNVLNATPAALESIGWDLEIVRDVEKIISSEVPLGLLLEDREVVIANIVSSGPNPELKLTHTDRVEIKVQHRVDLGPASYTLLSVPVTESMQAVLGRLWEIFHVFAGEFR
jgi:hypothetical protein